MPQYISVRATVVLATIIAIGLGTALAIPALANYLGQAAQHELGGQDRPPAAPCRYYVNMKGDGSDPDLDFSRAYTNVLDALAAAGAGPCEIWVAKGVYYPDEGGGHSDNDRSVSFVMTDGVALYGGFEVSDTTFSDRDWENNVTVLSGDIDQNDTVDANGVVTNATGIQGDNSYHVLTSSNVSFTAKLDGFTITAGSAIVGVSNGLYGGGMINISDGNPTLKNVVFSGNKATISGGGMYNKDSSPSMTNVNFTGNKAGTSGGGLHNISGQPSLSRTTFYSNTALYGGGMSNEASSPIIIKTVFLENYGSDYGGGIYNTSGSNPVLTDVTFLYNEGFQGGAGMANSSSSPQLTNVIFKGNTSPAYGLGGAGIFNQGNSNPVVTNAVFSGNYTGFKGAGISNRESNPVLTNVTFSGNKSAGPGGAMHNMEGSHPEARNTIFWNNIAEGITGTITASIKNEPGSVISIAHSLLQASGGSSVWGLDASYINLLGNIDSDPNFITPVNPHSAPTTSGDLHLKLGSPAIDSGSNAFFSGVTIDLDGEARLQDGDGNGSKVVDMGAYEANEYVQLKVTVTGTGSGAISSSPPGFDCRDTCTNDVKVNLALTLKAKPDPGSKFAGWSGDCSGKDDCLLVMDGDKDVTAELELGISHYLPLQVR